MINIPIRFFIEYKHIIYILPVNPENLEINIPGNNKTKEIIKIGEINLLRNRKLKELTIESFLPAQPFATYSLPFSFMPPIFFISGFDKIMEDKEPCRLVISGLGISMLVSIEDFSWKREGGDADTHYALKLKEYNINKNPSMDLNFLIGGSIVATAMNILAPKKKMRLQSDISVGNIVELKGNLYKNPGDMKSTQNFNNLKVRINLIHKDSRMSNRYYIETANKDLIGWARKSQLYLVKE